MNISKILAASAIATSIAFAQTEDDQFAEQAFESTEEAAEQSGETEEPQSEPEQQSEAAPAEESEQTVQPEQNAPAESQANNQAAFESNQSSAENESVMNEPQKASGINSKAGFGLHADFNYSFLYGLAQDWNLGDETDAPAGIGFDIGFRGRIPMASYLQFTPELNFHYAQLTQDDETAERKFTQMDLEIPLMIRGVVMGRFYAAAGIQLTLNLSSEVKFEEKDVDIGGGLGTMSMSFNEEVEQAGFGFGLIASVGGFVMERLSIDASIVLGLSDVYENQEENEDEILVNFEGGKQMTFKVGIGYWFM